MQTKPSDTFANWQRRLPFWLGLYSLTAGAISFSGWPLDAPRLTDWLNGGVSVQPNTAVLITAAGAAVLLLHTGCKNAALALGGLVAIVGTLNLLQYLVGADFGFNDLLLFGRQWGQDSTVSPGRFGPPASIALILIGSSLALLGLNNSALRSYVPSMALVVVLLMMFSLFGYLFGARQFFAIPALSAIALPTSTMLLALAVAVIATVPEHQPMLLLCEKSSAGAMARTVLPVLILMIPAITWFRARGYELEYFDLGTGRALSAATQVIGVVAIMWIALLALRRREQHEREADERKDEFLATLAHELRNPLAPICNATSILKLAYNDREAFDQATDTIDRQLRQLVRLIDDLLDASRITRGKLELRRERLELAPVIHQAVETCQPIADAHGIALTLALPSYPVHLSADPVRLSQVVCNLLSNACKFVKPQGKVSLTAAQDGDNVLITVRDNGIGIPPDKLEAIFDMFSQLDLSLERSRGGLGIGLTLARRLIELHGGTIEARSEGVGRGSEFVVRLPTAVDQRTTPPDKPNVEVKSSGKRRVLIVDDNRDSAETLAMFLRLTGNETFVAYDGEEAIDLASARRPAVILLDIGLPRVNGYEVCRRIRRNQWAEGILIVALTGWGQPDDRRKSAEAGFDDHLVKPVDHGELMNLLAREAPKRENRAPLSR